MRTSQKVTTYKNNKSGFRGVSYSENRGYKKWKAQITIRGEVYYLGRFEHPEEAALAYNEAAIKQYGREALINHL